jgi:hypothetical protein
MMMKKGHREAPPSRPQLKLALFAAGLPGVRLLKVKNRNINGALESGTGARAQENDTFLLANCPLDTQNYIQIAKKCR